jgi:hypothetical protein
MWSILALVVGLTVVIDDRLDHGGGGGGDDDDDDQIVAGPGGTVAPGTGEPTTTVAPPTVVPGPGQVRVAGRVSAVRLDGAVLEPREVATPLTIVSDRGFGNGGELTGVEIDGEAGSIVWDGGRPFILSSGSALVVGPVAVQAAPEGLRLLLGGSAHALTPGSYRLDTPVAVGSAGIATPRDTVTFVATEHSLFEPRGDAALVVGFDAPRRFTGPGRVQLEGELALTDSTGAHRAASFLSEQAAFDLTFTPTGDGGWLIDGLVDESRPADRPHPHR